MKIAYTWLQEFITTTLAAEELGKRLTMAGLEVESLEQYEQVKGSLKGVVVGNVLTCAPHPNADRLRVTTIDVGTGTSKQIVCGAPNVAAGQTVLVALPGATIYPTEGEPILLKVSKIRSIESEGMICAEDELGLGKSHDGILVLADNHTPGTPAAEALQLASDWVYEIGVTPNRADALSHYGVARDIGAVLNIPTRKPAAPIDTTPLPACPVAVSIADANTCGRYTGLVIRDVHVAESPTWLKQRLLAIGQRPINNIVDATNYVLHALGQPLHAFDLDKIHDNKIEVRGVPEGTPFVTLDGATRSIKASDLLICDPQGPLCIAGVMGGLESGVSASTQHIFLESAYFDGATLRNTSRRLQLFSDSSYRFERGTDPLGTVAALELAAHLIMQLAGGSRTAVVDVQPRAFATRLVPFRFDAARRLIGKHLTDAEMTAVLEKLEIEIVEQQTDGSVVLQVPLYRVDVTRQQDVVEEILRVHGYNEVEPAAKLNVTLSFIPASNPYALREAAAAYLAGAGFAEVLNNSLTSAASSTPQAVQLANPLSEELAVMRTGLHAGMLATLAHNLAHKTASGYRLFEMGNVYVTRGTAFQETLHLGILIAGEDKPTHWRQKAEEVDFFTLKGEINRLLLRLGVSNVKLEETETGSVFSYGLNLLTGKNAVGSYGKLSEELVKQHGVKVPVYYAELSLPMIEKVSGKVTQFAELPRYPTVRRDLSMLLARGVRFGALADAIVQTNPKLVTGVEAFDVYDKAVKTGEDDRKSYALSIYLQDAEQTLTDATIEKVMGRVVAKLEKDFGVEIRK